MTDEGTLKELYGDVPLNSAPVNTDKPTFDSLLSALESVHRGNEPMEVLVAYHRGLSQQLNDYRTALEEAAKDPGEVPDSQVRAAMAVLDMTQAMLDSVEHYIEKPSQELMAEVLDLLLQSMGHIRNLSTMMGEA